MIIIILLGDGWILQSLASLPSPDQPPGTCCQYQEHRWGFTNCRKKERACGGCSHVWILLEGEQESEAVGSSDTQERQVVDEKADGKIDR